MKIPFLGAPKFKAHPDPVNGNWKIAFLDWLRQITGIKILFETGTCEGVTPYVLNHKFRQIFTIELHEGLYYKSQERLSQFKNIRQYHGSSRVLLEKILKEDVPQEPVLFWLDAHNSGSHTANDGDPLPDEILTLTRVRPDGLIVVDDMISVDSFYRQVTEIHPSLVETLKDYQIEYRTGEIMLYKKGQHSIPEFDK